MQVNNLLNFLRLTTKKFSRKTQFHSRQGSVSPMNHAKNSSCHVIPENYYNKRTIDYQKQGLF